MRILNCIDEGNKKKTSEFVYSSSHNCQTGQDRTRTATKCAKMKNDRANRGAGKGPKVQKNRASEVFVLR